MTVQAAGLAGSKAIPQKTSSLEKPITIDVFLDLKDIEIKKGKATMS